MLVRSSKIKGQFTLTINYQPKGILTVSYIDDDENVVKAFDIKRELSEAKIIKLVNMMLDEKEERKAVKK